MGNIEIGALGSQINLSKSDDPNTKYERLMKVSEKVVLQYQKIGKSGWKMGNIEIGALESHMNLSKPDDLNTKYERLIKVCEKVVLNTFGHQFRNWSGETKGIL